MNICHTIQQVRLNPVQFLVANQGDKNPSDETSTFSFALQRAASCSNSRAAGSQVPAKKWIIQLNIILVMNKLFGFGNVRDFSQIWKTVLQLSILFSMFWKHSQNSDQITSNYIEIEHHNWQFVLEANSLNSKNIGNIFSEVLRSERCKSWNPTWEKLRNNYTTKQI